MRATALTGMAETMVITIASNSKVKPLSDLAQGTLTCLMPQGCIAHGEVSALARADPAWHRARRRQERWAPRKRAVAWRPSLTAAARAALGVSGRNEETAAFSRTRKHDKVASQGYPSKG